MWQQLTYALIPSESLETVCKTIHYPSYLFYTPGTLPQVTRLLPNIEPIIAEFAVMFFQYEEIST